MAVPFLPSLREDVLDLHGNVRGLCPLALGPEVAPLCVLHVEALEVHVLGDDLQGVPEEVGLVEAEHLRLPGGRRGGGGGGRVERRRRAQEVVEVRAEALGRRRRGCRCGTEIVNSEGVEYSIIHIGNESTLIIGLSRLKF